MVSTRSQKQGKLGDLISLRDTDNRLNSALSKTWSHCQPTVAATLKQEYLVAPTLYSTLPKHFFEHLLAVVEDILHVAADKQRVDQRLEYPARHTVVHHVGRAGALGAFLEAVLVMPMRVRATPGFVDEPIGWFPSSDLRLPTER